MTRNIISLCILGLVLMFVQVVALNNVCLFNVAVPFLFVMLIWRLPVALSVNWVMTIAFFYGLIDDVFADTYGMNTVACTVCAFVRKPVMRLYVSRDEDLASVEPSCRSLGSAVFAKYAFTMTLLFCLLVFVIEAFTFFNFWLLLGRIVFSTLLTFLLIFSLDSIMSRRRSEKRLSA